MRRRAIVGGAIIGGAVARNRAGAEQAQQPEAEGQPQPGVESAPAMDEKLAAVAKLGELHESGTLTDEEFAQQKAQILGS
jgi:hypothetical protein